MRVAYLVSDPSSASARVRIANHLPGLAARGIHGEIVPLPKGIWARRGPLASVRDHDVVVLHRRLPTAQSLNAGSFGFTATFFSVTYCGSPFLYGG